MPTMTTAVRLTLLPVGSSVQHRLLMRALALLLQCRSCPCVPLVNGEVAVGMVALGFVVILPASKYKTGG